MQGYAPGGDGAFAESRKCFGELEDWAASGEAAGRQMELEEQLEVRGSGMLAAFPQAVSSRATPLRRCRWIRCPDRCGWPRRGGVVAGRLDWRRLRPRSWRA